MQPGSDYNPYAAPTPTADASSHASYGYGTGGLLASHGQRFVGALLDGLFALLSAFPAIIGAAVKSDALLALGGLVVVGFQIAQAVLISTNKQSYGKKMMKTRIVRLDGSPPGFLYGVFMRSWVVALMGAIPFVGSVIGIVDPLLIFREDRRTLHDHIAGTNVIQT
jgi:uncharacterized RDD family membrane protein YckC